MFLHDLLIPLRRGAESEKGPQLAVSYISRDETGGEDMEKRMESEDLKQAYLWQAWLFVPTERLLELGTMIKRRVGRKIGVKMHNPLGVGAERR